MKDDDYLQLPFGFEQLVVSTFPIYHQRCATSALWMDESTLIIKSHIIDESIGSVLFHFHFNEEGFTLFIKKFEESLFQEFQGYFSS